MNWYEYIVMQGGPDWRWRSLTAGSHGNGRADFALTCPKDEVTMYPGNESAQLYRRTTRGWVSPLYGTIHTVFEHVGPA